MKNNRIIPLRIFSMAIYSLALSCFAQAGNLKGAWIDENINANYQKFKANHDLKAFCSQVYFQGENVDIATVCTPAGKVVSCPLNTSYTMEGGSNCQDRGTWKDSTMEVVFDDMPGKKVPATSRELSSPDHLEMTFKFTRNTSPPRVETMLWEVRRLPESEYIAFTELFQSCAK